MAIVLTRTRRAISGARVRRSWNAAISLILVNAIAYPHSKAQNEEPVGASLLSVTPRSWAVDAARNELIALHHRDSYLRYRMETVNEKGDQVRDVIESKDGTVARLILKDGKPLAPEEDKGERERLNDMIASPATYTKHAKNSESEKTIADKLVPLMPDAMINTYAPGQPQSGRNGGAPEIVLDYKPNPSWTPPNTEAQALTGLQGRVWIDAKSRYVIRMEGTVFRGVNFGWGMLAHIYPGGKLVLDQTDAGGNRWIFTDFSMQLSVRALMVKRLDIHSSAQSSNYQTIGPMSYQAAIRLLLATPLPER
ncbi:MAG TPA: hypothetical protein VHW70_06070 [Edaphobacter sp.]|nr:hypothetical protein [Edaphobacter sp.]